MTRRCGTQREEARGNGVSHAGQSGHHTQPADFDPGTTRSGLHAYPLSTEPLDGEVTVSDYDGELQECVRGSGDD
ncbi:hypothetical protein [Pseudoclavibacter sp. VKM Ac-2867]|uniref:hypothetical protein n=1 Tax=Pseudoclavibacter sp. VKM Ac-2867 TaxID=2783829 RepID=UPI00188C55A1|nr:hypothetical protein [Pseudoclavibacter sp. VKM Ac-2867]MBF4460530.1 hypothetical protein [Pseudoclavibacter sp. VKM Ac-2867]